jgi:alanyl-tRNA synthetase
VSDLESYPIVIVLASVKRIGRKNEDEIITFLDGFVYSFVKISALKRELMAYKLSKLEYCEGNLCIFEEEGDMLALRNLVNEAKKLCGGICAVFAGNDSDGYKYILSSTSVDLRAKSKEINAALSGRGGGSSEMIQGSCTATRDVIEKYFS